MAMAWSGDTRCSKFNYHWGQKIKRKKKTMKKFYLEILNNKCQSCIRFCYILFVRRTFPVILQVKADFLESLNSAEKQVHDYQSRLEALNENFCKAGVS